MSLSTTRDRERRVWVHCPSKGQGLGGCVVRDGFDAPLSFARSASRMVWDYSLRLPNDDQDCVAADGRPRRRRAHYIYRSTG